MTPREYLQLRMSLPPGGAYVQTPSRGQVHLTKGPDTVEGCLINIVYIAGSEFENGAQPYTALAYLISSS